MKTNKTINELKAIDKNAFKALNMIYGFDFEKDFTIVKLEGSFTINRVLKESGSIPEKDRIVITFLPDTKSWRHDKLMTVKITGCGASDFDVDFNRVYPHNTKVDNFHCKGDFNEYRKKPIVTFVIAQNKNLLARTYKTPVPDLSDRFFITGDREYNKRLKSLYTGLAMDITGNNCNSRIPENKNDVIDKSGYIVGIKRERLQKRAQNLRNERKKLAFKNTDNMEVIKNLFARLEDLKKAFANGLLLANTSDKIKNIANCLKWYDGLEGAYSELEYIEKGEKEKTFASIEDFNSRVISVTKKIENLEERKEAC